MDNYNGMEMELVADTSVEMDLSTNSDHMDLLVSIQEAYQYRNFPAN